MKKTDENGAEVQEDIEQLRLVDLPTDVIICILTFCDLKSLHTLCLTCKRINNVVSEDCMWVKRSNAKIITNQLSDEVKKRCFTVLSAKERCRVSVNWSRGCYTEKVYNTSTKYMPWLQLESSMLWVSRGNTILGVKRQRDSLSMQKPQYTIKQAHTEDISRFVKVDDVIFSGGRDKLICGWSTTSANSLLFCQHSTHSQDIQGLDCRRNTLASCSKDGTIKVWQVSLLDADKTSTLRCTRTVDVCDRVWCVSIDPSLTCVAAGSAGYYGIHPLNLYEFERGVELPLAKSVMRKGAAIFDIHWEDPNSLITCGFDAITRLWDVRLGECVGSWSDPFGAPGYCLASDSNFSVLCGTAHHGRAQLWDKRAHTSVQAFFGRRDESSPVYSVSFDSSSLFIAQDSCINLLDFSPCSSPNMPCADYSSFWKKSRA